MGALIFCLVEMVEQIKVVVYWLQGSLLVSAILFFCAVIVLPWLYDLVLNFQHNVILNHRLEYKDRKETET